MVNVDDRIKDVENANNNLERERAVAEDEANRAKEVEQKATEEKEMADKEANK